jgi:hypothetical protein
MAASAAGYRDRRDSREPPVPTPSNKSKLSQEACVVRHYNTARPMTASGHLAQILRSAQQAGGGRSRYRTCLCIRFPANREFNREFRKFEANWHPWQLAFGNDLEPFAEKFPNHWNREYFLVNTEFARREQGPKARQTISSYRLIILH